MLDHMNTGPRYREAIHCLNEFILTSAFGLDRGTYEFLEQECRSQGFFRMHFKLCFVALAMSSLMEAAHRHIEWNVGFALFYCQVYYDKKLHFWGKAIFLQPNGSCINGVSSFYLFLASSLKIDLQRAVRYLSEILFSLVRLQGTTSGHSLWSGVTNEVWNMSARTPAFQEMWKTGVFLIVSKPELMLILARCLLICTVEFNSDCLVFKPKSNILYSFLNSSINVTTGLHKGNYGMIRPPPPPPKKGFLGGGGRH